MDLSAALHATPTGERRRIDREMGTLVGSRCRHCGAASWPERAICFRCGSADLDHVAFSAHGQLLTYTTVWIPRPGIAPPYTLGLVRLDDGVSVFAHLRALPAEARVPLAVRLILAPDEGAIPPFWFEPDQPSQENPPTDSDYDEGAIVAIA